MDEKFTQRMQDWLDTPVDKRDLAAGALMVLQCDRNRILYRNIMLNPSKFADVIEYNMQKWLTFRLQRKTHAEVQRMEVEAERIAKNYNLDAPEEQMVNGQSSMVNRIGKRPDHDKLPLEIQSLYVENLDLLHRLREVHLRLRSMSGMVQNGEACSDSDRYPFLKELIALDKKSRSNWETYDKYAAPVRKQRASRKKAAK
ncbi:MAG: hypothetical protein IK023_01940 [Bacteroidaceae bacterium]|nr:hypothetical protein [Bacteroidaceae bacterium]